MERKTILVVDDEKDIRLLISYNLMKHDFLTEEAATGSEALKLAREKKFDLIILDLMMDDLSGLDVLRVLKTDDATKDIPVIIESAKTQDYDITKGLDLGGDDYITKPFSPAVLCARVKSVLRRYEKSKKSEKDNCLTTGTDKNFLTLNSAQHKITYEMTKDDGERQKGQLDLSATEFSIIEFLLKNKGFVFKRGQILDAVRGEGYAATERTIDVEICSIRRKLEDAGIFNMIETVRGVGYKIASD